MTDSSSEAPVLTIGDKAYPVESLTDKAKEAVAGLQVAESQIRMAEDQLKVLIVGRTSLMTALQAELAGVESITAD